MALECCAKTAARPDSCVVVRSQRHRSVMGTLVRVASPTTTYCHSAVHTRPVMSAGSSVFRLLLADYLPPFLVEHYSNISQHLVKTVLSSKFEKMGNIEIGRKFSEVSIYFLTRFCYCLEMI